MSSTLPPGNPNDNQRLQVQAIVYDDLGATRTLEFSVKSLFVPNVPVLIEKATMAFNDAMATGNLRSASQELTLFGGLLGHQAMTTDEMKEDAARLRTTLAGLVAEYYAPRGQRRRRSLLSSHRKTPVRMCAAERSRERERAREHARERGRSKHLRGGAGQS
jgi:hypothetical protein